MKNTYTVSGGGVTALTAGCVTAAAGCTPSTTAPIVACTLVANANAIFACYVGALNSITTTTASTWTATVCPPSTISYCKVNETFSLTFLF